MRLTGLPPLSHALSGRRTSFVLGPTLVAAVVLGLDSQSIRQSRQVYTAYDSLPPILDSAASQHPVTSPTA